MSAGNAGRFEDGLSAGLGIIEGNIIGNRALKKQGILRNYPNLAA